MTLARFGVRERFSGRKRAFSLAVTARGAREQDSPVQKDFLPKRFDCATLSDDAILDSAYLCTNLMGCGRFQFLIGIPA